MRNIFKKNEKNFVKWTEAGSYPASEEDQVLLRKCKLHLR